MGILVSNTVNSTNTKCHGSGELTLLDFLESEEGRNSNLAEKKFALAGGGTLTCPILTGGGYGADIYYQGTKVLTYLGSGYGWAYPFEVFIVWSNLTVYKK